MSYKYLILHTIFFYGCVTGQDYKQNSWALLEKAEEIDCSPWPVPESDIDTQNLQVVHANDKIGFVTTGRSRTAQVVRYWTRFEGSLDLEVSDLKKLEWGADPKYLGFSNLGQNPLVILEQGSKGRSIEFRNPSTNIIKFSKSLEKSFLSRGVGITHGNGAWLLYKPIEGVPSIEDRPWMLKSVDVSRKGKVSIVDYKGLKMNGDPRVYTETNGNGIAIWVDRGSSEAPTQGEFKSAFVTTTGKAFSTKVVDKGDKSEIESWDFIYDPNFKSLAWISGDSLLGNAHLAVAMMEWNKGVSLIKSRKEIALGGSHAGRPRYIKSDGKVLLVLPQWKTRKSTLAIFQLSPNMQSSPRYFGKFNETRVLQDVFTYGDDHRLLVVMKEKKRFKQNFYLCELDY